VSATALSDFERGVGAEQLEQTRSHAAIVSNGRRSVAHQMNATPSDPTASSNAGRAPADELDALRAVTAGLAHEIRNPLQFIKNYAEVVAELAAELRNIVEESASTMTPSAIEDLASLREELGQAGEQIVRHAGRLDAIIESMLATSQQGSGQRQLTDVNLLVKESAEFAYHGRAAAPESSRLEQLEFDLDPDLPLAMLDPLRMSRAVINLVVNALQAVALGSDTDAPTVRVRTRRTADGFSIVIEDNGPGIATDQRQRVFEPFFTTKRGRHHAGLGLTQVWDIVVSDHGGTVTIDSVAHGGATATIALPLAPPA
jgi:signal transduction histidine kinase